MAILAIVSVGILFVEYQYLLSEDISKILYFVDQAVLLIFAIDYFAGLFYAKNKTKYFKSNIPELIAIIPFSSLFRTARIIRILRLLKFLSFLIRGYKRFSKFLNTNGLNYALFITSIILCIGTIAIKYTEDMSFKDALWWTFVTITTVGYGDISPSTGMGRIIASFLMLVGIGCVGMLTGTIATFFIREPKENKSYKEETIESIKNQLDNIDNITVKDVEDICRVIKTLKNRS
jgi:voltage-gated potassium channel